jgi:hypothetical protein
VKWIVHYITSRNQIACFKCAFRENAIQMQEDLLAMGYCCWLTEDEESEEEFDF